MKTLIKRNVSRIKDPGSAITHFIAMLAAICATTPLLLKAARETDNTHFISLLIFILSMIGLYAASTIYHTLDISPKVNRLLRKLDLETDGEYQRSGNHLPRLFQRPGKPKHRKLYL